MGGLILGVHIVVSFFMIVVVLLQVGRGAELGAAFGSMGQASSSRGTTTFLGKFTVVMAVAFMLTSSVLTFQTSTSSKRSVLESISVDDFNRAPIATELEPVSTEKIELESSVPAGAENQQEAASEVSKEIPSVPKEESAK